MLAVPRARGPARVRPFGGRPRRELTVAIPGIELNRRLVSVVGALGLFPIVVFNWTATAALSPTAGFVLGVGATAGLAAVGVAAAATRLRTLRRLDVGVLVSALVLFAVSHVDYVRPGYDGGNDESYLGQDALRVLLAGHNPYRAAFAHVPALGHETPLLGGGAVTHYSYPPLTLLLGWPAAHVWRPLGEPWVVASAALLLLAVIVFLALPVGLRALVVPVVFGLQLHDFQATHGYPVLVAVALLCLATIRWTGLGRGGRLGPWGVTRAGALGFAASAHQLAWFVAVFLLVTLWFVRRGELSRSATSRVLLRVGGTALAVFAVLNAPFALDDPHGWAAAIFAPFTQHALPTGVGAVMATTLLIGGSGALQFYSYATVLLLVALLGFTAVGVRRLAPAVPLFASVVFFAATRSTADYVVDFVPLWLVWLVTAEGPTIAAARPLRLPARARRVTATPPRRVALGVAALLPAVGCIAVAVATPAPMTLRENRAVLSGGRLAQLQVVVDNRTGHPVRPSFYVDIRSHVSMAWRPLAGRLVLAAHARRTVELVPDDGAQAVVPHLRIVALSDGPPAFSSAAVRLPRTDIVAGPVSANPTRRFALDCSVRILDGGSPACATEPRAARAG